VWRLVRGLRDGGTTVLLTTHYLEEAEALADRLEIMHAGRIVRSGTPAEIAEGHPSTISFTTLRELPWLPDLDARRVIEEHGTTTIETDDLQGVLTDLLDRAARHGVRLERLEARTASLESVFLGIADGSDAPTSDTASDTAPAPEGALR
jgi:ABC-2 type transport system ATP-binding protein